MILRLWIAALLAGLLAPMTAVHAAETAPSAYDCYVAYQAAGKERARFQGDKARFNFVEHSIVELIENAESLQAYQYNDRATKLRPKIEALAKAKGEDFTTLSMKAGSEAGRIAEEMRHESAFAISDVRLNPQAVYVRSRAIMAQVHVCDLANGYSPVIGAPPAQDKIIAFVSKQSDAESARRNANYDARAAELAGLDDVQCAARFALLGQLFAQNPQAASVMQQKTAIAGNRAVVGSATLTQEKVIEQVRRAAQERATRIKGENDIYPLVQEANACETRYGLPLSTLGQRAAQ